MEFAIKEEYLLKHLNTLLKLLSTIDSDVLQLKPILQKQIKNELHQLITSLQKAPTTHFITEPLWNDISTNELEILPITILFSEGPIARAYLATLRSLGLTPQKIIHLVASHDVATRKPVGRLIPARWRARYAAGVQYSRMHYWPKRIAKEFPKLTRVLIDAITSTYHFDPDTITEANKSLPLTTYCAQVESLMVTSLRDPKLYEYLQQLPEQILLFTGGGIVPKELLEIPGLKFLHVHPGFLPEVRGADGLLWSGLLSGNPAASAFYLSPGIDTGAIVMASRLPAMQIPDLSEHDCKTLYRALYSYFDPWVRSCVLRQLLLINPKISHWPTTAQNEEDGVTFHFMQPWLQKLAILRLFGGLSSG